MIVGRLFLGELAPWCSHSREKENVPLFFFFSPPAKGCRKYPQGLVLNIFEAENNSCAAFHMSRSPVRAVGLHCATVLGPREASEILKANTRLQINTPHLERVLCSPGQGSSHRALCPSGKGLSLPWFLDTAVCDYLKGTCESHCLWAGSASPRTLCV